MQQPDSLRSRTAALFAAILLAVSSTSTLAQPPGDTEPARPPSESAITFATVDGSALQLDLYLPDGVSTPPLLIYVHGGAWRFGSREQVSSLGLLDEGFAIASVSFRLSEVAPLPAQVHDIKAAIRFLRANASDYGYDAARIAITGVSSGGHLAALVGLTNGNAEHEGIIGDHAEASSDVQAIVSWFGASNLTSILSQSTPRGLNVREPALDLLLGGLVEDKTELAHFGSPVFHVDALDPPLLLLHGDQDPQMPINQSHELHGAAKDAGIVVHFEVVHGAGHGGAAFFDRDRSALVADFLRDAFAP